MFNIFKRKTTIVSDGGWYRTWDKSGITIGNGPVPSDAVQLQSVELAGYLSQLIDDQLAEEHEDEVCVSWSSMYDAFVRREYEGLVDALDLPSFTQARLALSSSHALSDVNFSIAVAGWKLPNGFDFNGEVIGPVLAGVSAALMRPEQWELFEAVVAFSRRPESERNDVVHRREWGRIRKLAIAADAQIDDFLTRTVILTPESLDIQLRRSEFVRDDKVVEVIPCIPEAPDGWLELFDRRKDVPQRYDIATRDGIVQILVTEKVRTVLQEIKRMEGRRVAGARAQAFILNPYAALGPDADDVINEAQFEQARNSAGLNYERFVPVYERDASNSVSRVGLLIECADSREVLSSDVKWLNDESLIDFIDGLSSALEQGNLLFGWEGYDFELQGDAEQILADLRSAAAQCIGRNLLVSYDSVHDMSGYSARIEGIGEEKPYYSPYIAKKDEGREWFPENVEPMIVYDPKDGRATVAIPMKKEAIKRLKDEVERAEATGAATVEAAWADRPLEVKEAKDIVDTFERIFNDLSNGNTSELDKQSNKIRDRGELPKQLILRSNIQKVDYEEMRREALYSTPKVPEIPVSILPDKSLMPHQCAGLAWLQHRYRLQGEYQVRGAILADDMGLGKTFQLLSLMAWLLETTPNIEPMLVVAPVSLLENWAEEAARFFIPGSMPILTAYGSGLDGLRVPREQIDQRLQSEDKLVKFLKPNWIGDSKIILTTYETLRDLEFSFAAQKWSLMVCDEAQRIKNPAAMVTRAAKKQNVDFKIACTGTPVENTLADLWCLFDFVQPGFLGALNEFGSRYRKPIEAKTEEERARVEELRARIDGQILRRMKSEVAVLPEKIIVEDCRKLPISVVQRNYYAKSIESFKKRLQPDAHSPFKNHLGLLHYLRLVCTDPRPHGLGVFKPEPPAEYRAKSPKLDWLIRTLHTIRNKGQKAIVFCEFREIQRLLQHYINDEFGLKPDIINGDTSAAATHVASRQKRIKAFQAIPGFGVIILSPVAVGFGVNIQEANHVIHYTRTWNPAKEDQATDRAYRIGQTRDVYVYYPVVTADDFTTFDAKLDALLSYKRQLAEDMLNGSGDLTPGEFDLAGVVPAGSVDDLDERVTLDIALRMDWQRFECLVGALWAKVSIAAYRTPNSRDNGVDVVAFTETEALLIQVKASGIDGYQFNWGAVKEVVGGEAFYRRKHGISGFRKVCITNQFFNKHAHENAALNQVELLDQRDLSRLLESHQVMMLDVERMLFSEWH